MSVAPGTFSGRKVSFDNISHAVMWRNRTEKGRCRSVFHPIEHLEKYEWARGKRAGEGTKGFIKFNSRALGIIYHPGDELPQDNRVVEVSFNCIKISF